jgi:hypothetical protein
MTSCPFLFSSVILAAEASVAEYQVVGFEQVQELAHPGQFRLVLVALSVIEKHTTEQTEDRDQLEQPEPAGGFWGAGLGVSALVLGGVGGGDAGAIDDFGMKYRVTIVLPQ